MEREGERVRGREGGREKKRRDDGGRDRWSETKESSDLQLAAGSNQRRAGLGRREEKKEEKKNPRDHTALLLSFCERSTACVCSPANLPSRRAASQCSCSRKPSIWICSTIHLCKPAVVKNNHATYFTVSPLTRSRTCARATHTHTMQQSSFITCFVSR